MALDSVYICKFQLNPHTPYIRAGVEPRKTYNKVIQITLTS